MSASHHDREEETLIAYFQQMLAEVDDAEFDGEIQASDGGIGAKPVEAAAYSQKSNQRVLENANAMIESSHAAAGAAAGSSAADDTHDGMANPSGGLERISTGTMLSREMEMAVESAVMADELQPKSAQEYNQENTSDYQSTKDQETYGYSRVDPALQLATDMGDIGLEPEPEPQLQEQTKSEVALDYAAPSDSLQRLLATIDTTTDTATATETETKTATATTTTVAEPQVETATAVETPAPAVAVAEATVTETAPAVEQAVAVKAPEPVVAEKVEVETATAVETPAPAVAVAAAPVATKQEFKTPAQLSQERMSARLQQIAATWENVDLGEQFQVLFFLVQGVRFAVPLIDLGGIFECEKITQLFGKPSWFMGITDIRGTKINIVNTLRWVMPDIDNSPEKYPYLISLGTSDWSIGCDVLEGNRTLQRSQIKWREIPGSRPWLAGIVTSEKCALLHVKALISLFEAGADIEDLTRDLEEKGSKK